MKLKVSNVLGLITAAGGAVATWYYTFKKNPRYKKFGILGFVTCGAIAVVSAKEILDDNFIPEKPDDLPEDTEE